MTAYKVPILSMVSVPLVEDIIQFDGTNWIPTGNVPSRILVLESEMSAVEGAAGWTNGPSQASVHSQTQSRVLVLESEISAVESDLLVEKSTVNAVSEAVVTIQGGQGHACHVHKNATDQTYGDAGSYTKITFSTAEWDLNNEFANSRFTPTVAGYYFVHLQITLLDMLYPGYIKVVIYKNGGLVYAANCQIGDDGAGAAMITGIVYCDGTDDYIEAYCQTNTAGRTIRGNITLTYMDIIKLDL